MGSHRFFFSDGFLSFFFYLLDFLLVVVFTFSFPTMIRSFVRKIKRGKKNAKMEANSNDGNDKDNNNENNDKDKNMDFNNDNNKKNKDKNNDNNNQCEEVERGSPDVAAAKAANMAEAGATPAVIREPADQCQCPEPHLEPGFPRWWKKTPEPKPKEVVTKKEEKAKEPKKARVQLKCRGANHILHGPCVCESETEIRLAENPEENKDFIVYRGAREMQTPYAFLRAHPGGEFPGHVGDAVHLIFKDKAKGEYECRLADGTGRHATIPIEYLDVIVDVDNILKEAA